MVARKTQICHNSDDRWSPLQFESSTSNFQIRIQIMYVPDFFILLNERLISEIALHAVSVIVIQLVSKEEQCND